MAIAANMAKLGVSTFQCPGRETLPSYGSLLRVGDLPEAPGNFPLNLMKQNRFTSPFLNLSLARVRRSHSDNLGLPQRHKDYNGEG